MDATQGTDTENSLSGPIPPGTLIKDPNGVPFGEVISCSPDTGVGVVTVKVAVPHPAVPPVDVGYYLPASNPQFRAGFKDEARGLLADGYTTPANVGKVPDPDLIESMTDVITNRFLGSLSDTN